MPTSVIHSCTIYLIIIIIMIEWMYLVPGIIKIVNYCRSNITIVPSGRKVKLNINTLVYHLTHPANTSDPCDYAL